MKTWNLGEDAIESLQQLPETGMGFQIVSANCMGNLTSLLIFNSKEMVKSALDPLLRNRMLLPVGRNLPRKCR